MKRWGKEKVIEFIDHVLRIETLIDPATAFDKKVYKDPVIRDSRQYHYPVHLNVKEGHDYMEGYVNPPEWMEKQRKEIERKEAAEFLELFKEPTKDVLGFIRDYAPLKPWQADIVAIIHEEAMYFSPQRPTKMLNEGWASFVDFNIMAERGFSSLGQASEDMGIIQYAKHKMGVLGGKYSMNPYKLGFCLFQDIEERWNKGRFGTEYDECKNMKLKEDWDKKLGLGHEKVLEVRKYCNDFTALAEFFTPEFCDKYEFYEWKHYPTGEYILEDRDPKRIRKKLMMKYLNGGLPDIRLVDQNLRGQRIMLLQHVWDGRQMYAPYARATLESLRMLWGNPVCLATKDANGEEIVYFTAQPGDVAVMTRETFESSQYKI
jgi:stage V sporulation protein R